jgi:type II secretory pathway component PulF
MKFRYRAKDLNGSPITGVLEASDKKAVANTLRDQKLVPLQISVYSSGLSLSSSVSGLTGVSQSEVTNFTRQLSTMITAGLPLTDSLVLLKSQSSPTLAAVVGTVLADIQGGMTLSDSLGKHPEVFSKVYVSLVRAGEAAGVLETILNRLADSMEKAREFSGKIKGALVYPVIIVIGMIGVMIIMMVSVVPKLTVLYSEFSEELPLMTQIVIGMSNFMVHFWWLLIILSVIGFFGFRAFISNPAGKRKWDDFVFRFPITQMG